MNILALPKTNYTPEDLLAMPDEGKDYELVDGRLVERNMGMRSSFVGGRILLLLGAWCDSHGTGCVYAADAGYQCFANHPNKVRKADVSFISFERQPAAEIPDGYSRIPPDLAVEVVSPNDLVDEVDEKILEYLEAGVRLVWIVRPRSRLVEIHRTDGTSSLLRDTAEIAGEPVLPGFRCPVALFFQQPPTAP